MALVEAGVQDHLQVAGRVMCHQPRYSLAAFGRGLNHRLAIESTTACVVEPGHRFENELKFRLLDEEMPRAGSLLDARLELFVDPNRRPINDAGLDSVEHRMWEVPHPADVADQIEFDARDLLGILEHASNNAAEHVSIVNLQATAAVQFILVFRGRELLCIIREVGVLDRGSSRSQQWGTVLSEQIKTETHVYVKLRRETMSVKNT